MAESPVIRVGRAAMACRFEVLLPGGCAAQVDNAAAALDLVDSIEEQLSVYRPESELSRLNRTAAQGACTVDRRLFALLQHCTVLHHQTEGAFDVTIGPLLHCWGFQRRRGRIPGDVELAACLEVVGTDKVQLDARLNIVTFKTVGVEINLGAIGKGFALDVALTQLAGCGVNDVLLHGGYSSMLARGGLDGQSGWRVGIRDPLRPGKRLATLRLCNQGLATSGSGEQFFRHQGRRYSHVLDPRSGRAVEGMLSVTVLAPSAAEADALATAFFVLGVDKTCEYCENHSEVSALLVPQPKRGGPLQVVRAGRGLGDVQLDESR